MQQQQQQQQQQPYSLPPPRAPRRPVVGRITIFRCLAVRYTFPREFGPDSAPRYLINRAFTGAHARARATRSPRLNPVIFYCGFHPRAAIPNSSRSSSASSAVPRRCLQSAARTCSTLESTFYIVVGKIRFRRAAHERKAACSLTRARDEVMSASTLLDAVTGGFRENERLRSLPPSDTRRPLSGFANKAGEL